MLKGNALPWLFEEDVDNPGIRYFALRDLLDRAEDAPDLRNARKAIMVSGPVPKILAAQQPEGYWIPQRGINQSTASQILFLTELGIDPSDKRVGLACNYMLDHIIAPNHAFAYFRLPPASSRAVHCDNGHLVNALIRLGFGEDRRVQAALEWQVQAIIGKLPANQYYKSGTAGPNFVCGVNKGQPCGWGAIKAMQALVAIPENKRTADMRQAIKVGSDFLLSYDLATANFPYTERISSNWFKFGFPLTYWSDLLETCEVLVDLGFSDDPRLAGVFQFILSKQDDQGRWKLEKSLNGKMWVDIESKGRPSKWITLRALRVLKRAGKVLFQDEVN